jgi:predicted RNA-binding protein with PUA domain
MILADVRFAQTLRRKGIMPLKTNVRNFGIAMILMMFTAGMASAESLLEVTERFFKKGNLCSTEKDKKTEFCRSKGKQLLELRAEAAKEAEANRQAEKARKADPHWISDADAQIGVEKDQMQKYLSKMGCALAVGVSLGRTSAGAEIQYPTVLCIGTETVNPGGVHESRGCTLFKFNTQNGRISGLNRYGKDWPQVKSTCENNGVRELLNKDWGGFSIGKWVLAGENGVGVHPDLIFTASDDIKNAYQELKFSKGEKSVAVKSAEPVTPRVPAAVTKVSVNRIAAFLKKALLSDFDGFGAGPKYKDAAAAGMHLAKFEKTFKANDLQDFIIVGGDQEKYVVAIAHSQSFDAIECSAETLEQVLGPDQKRITKVGTLFVAVDPLEALLVDKINAKIKTSYLCDTKKPHEFIEKVESVDMKR